MKIEILSIVILSVLYRLDAKAFQTNEDASENKYTDIHYDKTSAELHSSGIYSEGNRNYEMRYVPYVDGQPIFIPSMNFNEQSLPTTSTLKIRPKQWQSRYYNTKTPHLKTNVFQHNAYQTTKHETKGKNENSHSEPYDSVKSLKKAAEMLDKIVKKQEKKTNSNLIKSKTPTDELKYESPQIIKSYGKKEIDLPDTKTKTIDEEYEYDLPEVKGAISKGKQTDFNIDNYKNPASDHYDPPEVVNSATKVSFEDYDIPIIKRPVEEKVKEKQFYKHDLDVTIKDSDYKAKPLKQIGSHTKMHGSAVTETISKTYNSGSDMAITMSNKLPTKKIKPTIIKGVSKKETTKVFKPEMKDKPKHHKNQNTNDKLNYGYSSPISNTLKYEKKNKERDQEREVGSQNIKEIDEYDYDSPVVVEARVKKNYPQNGYRYENPKKTLVNDNLGEDYSDYENPVGEKVVGEIEPVQSFENTKTVKASKETAQPNTVKDTEYQSFKYPVYFDSKKPEDITKHHSAPILQTPSPIISLKDIVEDSKTPQAESPHNEEMLSDQFDGSGLVDTRISNEDSRNLLKSSVWSLMSNFHSQERNKFKKCLTPDKEPGNCMPIQMCPVPNLQLTLDDLLKKVCTIDDVFIGICCPEFPAETLKVQWDNINQNLTSDEGNHTTKPEECGQFIESGKDVQSWPWMAPLISVSTRRIFCGGVLIKEQYVLTAAHCTRKIPRNQILVVLGPLNSEQDPTNQEFAVVEIKRHAQYNPRTMQNDIALLKLSRKVPLGDKRRFICLPDEEETNIGEEAFMLGWQGSFSASKNEESLRVISPEVCRKNVKNIVGPNVMCTEPRTENVMCNLDSGAPLTVKRDGKFHVIGLMTWNRNDCDSDIPTIFTRVSHFKKWIENHSLKP